MRNNRYVQKPLVCFIVYYSSLYILIIFSIIIIIIFLYKTFIESRSDMKITNKFLYAYTVQCMSEKGENFSLPIVNEI